MRKLFVCAFAFLCLTANVSAQTAKDIRKERQEIRKASKSELNEKATKTARKDAKKLKKEGWITVPGALPLEKQLDKSYMMQMEYDEDAASVTQSIMGAKNLISQSIGRTIIVMECYRVKTNKNKEVLVRIAYNGAMAKAAAKRAIQDELKSKSDDLQKKLDQLLGW